MHNSSHCLSNFLQADLCRDEIFRLRSLRHNQQMRQFDEAIVASVIAHEVAGMGLADHNLSRSVRQIRVEGRKGVFQPVLAGLQR